MFPPQSVCSFDAHLASISKSVEIDGGFDEKAIMEDLFRSETFPFPSVSDVTITEAQPASVESEPGLVMMNQTPNQTPHQTPNQPQSFIDIVMIVDPATQRVVCPRQILTYTLNGKTEKVVFGPAVLNAMPQDMVNLSSSMASQQASPQAVPSTATTTTTTTTFVPPAAVSPPATPPPTLDANNNNNSNNFDTDSIDDTLASTVSFSMPHPDLPESSGFEDAPSVVSSSSSSSSSCELPVPFLRRTSSNGFRVPPLRALSAYNFYFRDERDRILHGGDLEFSLDKLQRLLYAHWNQDRTKKRRHRKVHGKIDFTTLSRLISTRWKELSEEGKEFYRQVAAQDWERFQRELDECKKGIDGSGTDSSSGYASSSPSSGTSTASAEERLVEFQSVIG